MQKDASYGMNKQGIKERILNQYLYWQGVPYQSGGSNKKGVDCSAFVQIMFLDQFNISLPRTTSQQRHVGGPVKRVSLNIGDIILFKINKNTHHVGIYLGDNQFIHSSTSKGVIISNLANNYWSQRYQEARRVLNS